MPCTSSRWARRVAPAMLLPTLVLVLSACALPTWTPGGAASTTDVASPGVNIEPQTAGTAVVGLVTDYGQCDDAEAKVEARVRAWNPDVVVTTGDNTQGVDGCVPYTESVAAYYGHFLNDPRGPRFFPATGNHDYEDNGQPAPGGKSTAYTDFFDYLPTNADAARRWYSARVGPVMFYMLDSDAPEPDLALQRTWLRTSLAAAPDGVWKVVLFHRPPFTSGPHDPFTPMSPSAGWDYKGWGVDIVLNGHQHVFEDVIVDGMHYVTTGVGGRVLERDCPTTRAAGSQTCIKGPGAVRLKVTESSLKLQYRLLDAPDEKAYQLELTR